MNTLAINNPLASEIKCTEDELIVSLKDGRVLHLPLSWFPRLLHATPSQRNDFEILGFLYWEVHEPVQRAKCTSDLINAR